MGHDVEHDIGNYGSQAKGIADELGTVYPGDYRQRIAEMAGRPGGLQSLMNPDQRVMERACRILGSAPGQIRKTTESLAQRDPDGLTVLLITATALGRMASKAIYNERQFGYVIGKGYREATRAVASVVMDRRVELREQLSEMLELYVPPRDVDTSRVEDGKDPAALIAALKDNLHQQLIVSLRLSQGNHGSWYQNSEMAKNHALQLSLVEQSIRDCDDLAASICDEGPDSSYGLE